MLLHTDNKFALQGGESQSEVGARVISSVERIASQHPGKYSMLVCLLMTYPENVFHERVSA